MPGEIQVLQRLHLFIAFRCCFALSICYQHPWPGCSVGTPLGTPPMAHLGPPMGTGRHGAGVWRLVPLAPWRWKWWHDERGEIASAACQLVSHPHWHSFLMSDTAIALHRPICRCDCSCHCGYTWVLSEATGARHTVCISDECPATVFPRVPNVRRPALSAHRFCAAGGAHSRCPIQKCDREPLYWRHSGVVTISHRLARMDWYVYF